MQPQKNRFRNCEKIIHHCASSRDLHTHPSPCPWNPSNFYINYYCSENHKSWSLDQFFLIKFFKLEVGDFDRHDSWLYPYLVTFHLGHRMILLSSFLKKFVGHNRLVHDVLQDFTTCQQLSTRTNQETWSCPRGTDPLHTQSGAVSDHPWTSGIQWGLQDADVDENFVQFYPVFYILLLVWVVLCRLLFGIRQSDCSFISGSGL